MRVPRRAAFALAVALASCAHQPNAGRREASVAPIADSVTAALWHFDELGGQGVADDTPAQLGGVAGLDTQVEFGRFGRARSFVNSVNSFVVVEANPLLDLQAPFTIEAWVRMRSYPAQVIGTIVSRMQNTGNQRAYILAITGGPQPLGAPPDPMFASDPRLQIGEPGHVWFAFVPGGAWSGLYSFISVGTLDVERWTHVAVTYNGSTLRFYLDGRLDSQHAASGEPARVRPPLMIGNTFDANVLSDFSGQLQVQSGRTPAFSYPFDGLIDELRISSAARTEFGLAGR